MLHTCARIRSGTLGCMAELYESVTAPYCINAFSLSAQMKSSLPFQLLGSLVSPTAVFSYNLVFQVKYCFFSFFPVCKSVFNLKTHCSCFQPSVLSYLSAFTYSNSVTYSKNYFTWAFNSYLISRVRDIKWFMFQKSTRKENHQKKYKSLFMLCGTF